MNITELIERLQEIQENHGDDDVVVMGMHQQSYPLREVIGAVWDPENDRDWVHLAPYECAECGERQESTEDDLPRAYWNTDDDSGYTLCKDCAVGEKHQDEDARSVVYIRLDGAPYSINPYGTKAAWDD